MDLADTLGLGGIIGYSSLWAMSPYGAQFSGNSVWPQAAAAPTCPTCGQAIGYGYANTLSAMEAQYLAQIRFMDKMKPSPKEFRDDFGRVVKAWVMEGM